MRLEKVCGKSSAPQPFSGGVNPKAWCLASGTLDEDFDNSNFAYPITLFLVNVQSFASVTFSILLDPKLDALSHPQPIIRGDHTQEKNTGKFGCLRRIWLLP